MIPVDLELERFVQLLDAAIASTEAERGQATDPTILGQATKTMEILESFRGLAISGQIPRPSKGDVPPGTGLGLGRGVGEWSQSDALLDAVYAVERYYREAL